MKSIFKYLKKWYCKHFGHNYWSNKNDSSTLRCARCDAIWKLE